MPNVGSHSISGGLPSRKRKKRRKKPEGGGRGEGDVVVPFAFSYTVHFSSPLVSSPFITQFIALRPAAFLLAYSYRVLSSRSKICHLIFKLTARSLTHTHPFIRTYTLPFFHIYLRTSTYFNLNYIKRGRARAIGWAANTKAASRLALNVYYNRLMRKKEEQEEISFAIKNAEQCGNSKDAWKMCKNRTRCFGAIILDSETLQRIWKSSDAKQGVHKSRRVRSYSTE